MAYCRPNPDRNSYVEKGLVGEVFFELSDSGGRCSYLFVCLFCFGFQYFSHLRRARDVHVYLQTKPVTLASFFSSRFDFSPGSGSPPVPIVLSSATSCETGMEMFLLYLNDQ